MAGPFVETRKRKQLLTYNQSSELSLNILLRTAQKDRQKRPIMTFITPIDDIQPGAARISWRCNSKKSQA
jgi:hypothetical protein